MNNTNF